MDKKKLEYPDITSTAAATETTGLMQTPPENDDELENLIIHYDNAVALLSLSNESNNGEFCKKFREQVEKLFQ